jgi:hypothetical protein
MSCKPKSSPEQPLAVLPHLWLAIAIAAFCLCVWATATWETRLASPLTVGTPLLQAYAAASAETRREPQPATAQENFSPSQRIAEQNGILSAEYGYRNFNSDPLHTRFTIPTAELEDYRQDYGYHQSDLDALLQWQDQARADALQQVRQQGLDQQRLNQLTEKIYADYRSRYRELLISRGFKFLSENLFAPDIPAVVQRNISEMHDIARSLSRTADELGYDSSEIIGAALSLAQTALHYAEVPAQIDGRMTAGIYPPVEALARGKGDCDSKTALLASILLNWDQIQLVGVGVPNHYLMGILQNPAKGELFVEYQGLPYVLIEPAGPAWLPPGTIADYTLQLLEAGDGVTIDPLGAHNRTLN